MKPLAAVWLFGLLWVFAGCNGPEARRSSAAQVTPPDSILDRDTYKAILTEALLIEAARKQRVFRNDDDSLRLQAAYEALFAQHGIAASEFEDAQAWWFGEAEAMIPLLQEVTEAISDQERDWEAR